jgi:2-oxoglutarate ferredoxin oxidoreductase subunit beta
MTYLAKPKFHHPGLPRNELGYTHRDYEGTVSTLCAGCGHDSITASIIQACFELSIEPHRVAKISGIGCSSKTPTYFLGNSHGFNSVHGRMPSVLTGANLANRDLIYLGVSGDGDSASIGFGQFAHAVRRGVNMAYIVENNGVYGLTKGQFSATADRGSKSKRGVINTDNSIDLVAMALQLGAGFVARSFSGDKQQLVPIIKAAIQHKGASFIDVISPCVAFNNHAGSTKSFDFVREHNEAVNKLDFISSRMPIEVRTRHRRDRRAARRFQAGATQTRCRLRRARPHRGHGLPAKARLEGSDRHRSPLHGQGRRRPARASRYGRYAAQRAGRPGAVSGPRRAQQDQRQPALGFMKFRQLGQSDLRIAPIMLGGNVFGWNADEKTSFALLDAFVDTGFNAIDTANSYSRWVSGHKGGESEAIIGGWLKKSGKRNKAVIATKVGADMGDGMSVKKDYILRQAEDSLKRLQVDCIDLYQTHFDDAKTPVDETLSAYAQLIKQGKVRAIGASNMSVERLKESLASGLPRYQSLQPNYNLYDRKAFETEYEPICLAEKLGVISYYSLAAGFLTGKYRSAEEAAKNPARGGKVKHYFDARGLAVLKALDEVSARHNATPAQVSLAWLIARPSVTAPIVSATSVKQLGEILKAAALKLTVGDIAALDKASAY